MFLVLCLYQGARTFNLGGDYRVTALTAFYYIFLSLVFYQVLLDRLKKKDIEIGLIGLRIIILVQLVYMYFQVFGIDPLFKIGEPYASRIDGAVISTKHIVPALWGHTNLSAASLAITLPLFFRRWWWVAVPFVVVMIVCAQSLGAVLAAAAGIMFYFLFNADYTKIGKLIILVAVLVGVFFYGHKVDSSQFSLNNDRISLLKPTVKMIKRHWIIGYGLEQYKIAAKQIRVHVFKNTRAKTTNPHNEFAETVFNLGTPGGIIIMGFFISLFISFLKTKTSLSLLAMSGVVAGLVNSCSTFIFHTPLAWIILLLIVAVKKGGKYEERRNA